MYEITSLNFTPRATSAEISNVRPCAIASPRVKEGRKQRDGNATTSLTGKTTTTTTNEGDDASGGGRGRLERGGSGRGGVRKGVKRLDVAAEGHVVEGIASGDCRRPPFARSWRDFRHA